MPSNPIHTSVSSAGTSRVINLDWMTGGTTTIVLTAASTTASATAIIQATLDDVMLTTSSAVTWVSLSSNFSTFGSTIPALVIQASNITDTPFIGTFPMPIAALRISSTTFSTSGFSLDVLQGQGF